MKFLRLLALSVLVLYPVLTVGSANAGPMPSAFFSIYAPPTSRDRLNDASIAYTMRDVEKGYQGRRGIVKQNYDQSGMTNNFTNYNGTTVGNLSEVTCGGTGTVCQVGQGVDESTLGTQLNNGETVTVDDNIGGVQ